MRSRVRHELKTWPEFFAATKRGHKKFELRRDDRPEGFRVGDELLLKEWSFHDKWCRMHFGAGCDCAMYLPQGYTGEEILMRVDYIMDNLTLDRLMENPNRGIGLSGFVIMSVSLVN